MPPEPDLSADAPAARNCAHCGAPGTTRFCGECGRPRDAAPAAGLLRESVVEVLGVEHGMWGTVRDLLVRPVKVFHAYLYGSPDGYVRPLKLFFLLAGAYMLLLSIVRPITFEPFQLLGEASPELSRTVAELAARHGVTAEVVTERVQGRMNTATPLVIALALLPMAMLLKAMRRERPFTDHVMFILTFSNCVWMLSILSLPLMRVAPGAASLALQVVGYTYVGIGFFAFYRARTRARTALKFAGYVAVDLVVTYIVGLLLFAGVLLSAIYL